MPTESISAMNPIVQPAADALGQLVFMMGACGALAVLIPAAFTLVRYLTKP